MLAKIGKRMLTIKEQRSIETKFIKLYVNECDHLGSCESKRNKGLWDKVIFLCNIMYHFE
jgi:hypothetical protein